MITVVSRSMRDAGFEVGDKAFIKQVAANELAVGDYIAFFDYVDPDRPRPSTIANGEKPTSNPRKNRIVFHEIIKIETDGNGIVKFFKFVNSTTGIVLLVVIPCVIILFRDCYELMSMIFEYSDEKKKIKREKELAALKTASTEGETESAEKKQRQLTKMKKKE